MDGSNGQRNFGTASEYVAKRKVEHYPFGTQPIGGSKDFREDANP
jgi:hypothetical protein